MISLIDKDLKEAKKYHKEKIEIIFDDIHERKKTIKGERYEVCQSVVDFIKKNKTDLIEGKPMVLLSLHNSLNINLKLNEKKSTKVIFENVYEKHFQKNYGKEFLNKLDIHTCVYCNRNYTLDLKKLNNSRAQIDHWFPKDKFPLLALSFYNLIPSCQSCNHIKGNGDSIIKKILVNDNASDEEILKWWSNDALNYLNHPYVNKSNFKFTWFFHNSLNDTKIEFKNSCLQSENTNRFNKTKEIYNAHSDKELKDLLDLRYKYSKNYLEILLEKTFTELSMSKEEAYRMIFGIEIKEEDYHKRPFSKFKHDIIEELLRIK